MRLPDWEQRLHDYIAGLGEIAFGYDREAAQVDCCTFVAGAAGAITGSDPMVEFRGEYATEAASKDALKRLGRGTLARTMDSKFKRVPAAFAQRGDIVMHDGSIGICVGGDALFVSDDGLTRVSRALWRKRAWKVG